MSERVIWGEHYAIYDEIASGGMATVYMAARLGASPNVPPVVALKKLAEQFAKQPEFVAMFLDEAHLAARIRHANVVTTYEFLRTSEGLGIVMDLVVGESLVRLLRGTVESGTSIPLPVAAAILAGALEGLHAAHEVRDDAGRALGLVHRDVSPHNIIVGADGVARVIDFGIAKAAGRLQTTDVGVLKGKFAYMSPEQIQGAAVDRTTDIYSAGIVLWETVTGRKVFRASSNEELLIERSSGKATIPLASSISPWLPPELDEVILRAMHVDPSKRYATARSMAQAIRVEIGVADTDVVAAWLWSHAGERIDEIEGMRRRIEASLASTLAEPSRPIDQPTQRSRGVGPPPAPVVDIPESPGTSVPPKRSDRPPSMNLGGSEPPALPPSPKTPAAPRRFAENLVLDDPVTPGAGEREVDLELAPALPRTSSPAPARPLAPLRPRRRSRTNLGAFPFAAVVLVLAFGGFLVVRGPALLKSRVLAGAGARGLVLALDHVALTRDGLALSGVKASLVGCPSVQFAAAEVHVALDRSGAMGLAGFSGYELSISGRMSDVTAQIAAWRRAPHIGLAAHGTGGHLTWQGVMPTALGLEALDVSLELAASPDAAVSVDTTSLLVNVPRGHMGPWRAHLESSTTGARARIGFDASTPDGSPSITFIERPAEGASLSLEVPRGSTFKIGIPAELFGLTSDLSLEADLRAHADPSGTSIAAEGHVGLYGLPVAASARGTMTLVDLEVTGAVKGDPKEPLGLLGGTLTLGKVPFAVSGLLTVEDDGLRMEIDRPPLHGGTGPALVLDTREWTGAAR